MNLKKNKYFSLGVMAFFTFAACLLFKQFISSFRIEGIFSAAVGILMPFMIGFTIAYLLNPVMEFLEKKVIGKLFAKRKFRKKKSAVRAISVVLTLVIALAVIVALLGTLIPQVILSIIGIIRNLPDYVREIYNFIYRLVEDNENISKFVQEQFKDVSSYAQDLSNMILPSLSSLLSSITAGVFSFIGGLIDAFMGLVVSIYVLFAKERFISQCKKVLVALTPKKFSLNFISLIRETHTSFGKFFTGKIIDSTIIGVIIGIGTTFIHPSYAILIGVVMGVFNLIPFFGPIIGAVPCALLILLESPQKCLIFIIFVIIMQQFDANILEPRIVGGATGLNAFWVMFAILLFSTLFGFVGMFIGVPVFSVIYTLVSRYINGRLEKKGLSTKTQDYLYMGTRKAKQDSEEAQQQKHE